MMPFVAAAAAAAAAGDVFTYTHLKKRHILLMFQSVGSKTIYDLIKEPAHRNASTPYI